MSQDRTTVWSWAIYGLKGVHNILNKVKVEGYIPTEQDKKILSEQIEMLQSLLS